MQSKYIINLMHTKFFFNSFFKMHHLKLILRKNVRTRASDSTQTFGMITEFQELQVNHLLLFSPLQQDDNILEKKKKYFLYVPKKLFESSPRVWAEGPDPRRRLV